MPAALWKFRRAPSTGFAANSHAISRKCRSRWCTLPCGKSGWCGSTRKRAKPQKKRRSPKTGTPFAAFVELYKIRQLLPHPNLRIQIIPVDVEEHRSLTGWSRDRKRGSTRLERLPVAFGDAIWLATPTDYAALLPSALTDPFTTADLATEARLSRKAVQCSVNVMWHLGAIVPLWQARQCLSVPPGHSRKRIRPHRCSTGSAPGHAHPRANGDYARPNRNGGALM